MKNIYVLTILLIFTGFNMLMAQYESKGKQAESSYPWPDGKRCAVSFTFDDARLSQVDKGVALLDKFNVKATFYISPGNCMKRIDMWKQTAANGHEIGNHTASHPCSGNLRFSRNNALENYTPDMIHTELTDANDFIKEQFGVTPKSFAYPCGQKFTGVGSECQSYIPMISEMFTSGRGWRDAHTNNPYICDLAQLLAMESDGKSFEELKTLIDTAIEEGTWLIFAGHEMDTGGRQTTQLNSLEQLFQYLDDISDKVWVDTVGNIADYIQIQRK